MWGQIITAVIAAVALLFAFYLWNQYRDKIAAWLRENNLERSALMEAVVFFDKVSSYVKTKLQVYTQKTGRRILEEKTLTQQEVADLMKKEPEIARIISQGRTASVDLIALQLV